MNTAGLFSGVGWFFVDGGFSSRPTAPTAGFKLVANFYCLVRAQYTGNGFTADSEIVSY